MLVPLEPVRAETRASNSRFISCLSPVDSPAAAREFVAAVKAEFPDATHHVPAFVVGGGNSVTEFCSDDGEPSGTAGRPLLAVLKGSGLGNVAVVAVRYFGGTLLGTGGLVRAYQEAGRAVLALTSKAELRETLKLSLTAPYALLERTRMLVSSVGGRLEGESFGEAVELSVDLPAEALERLATGLSDLSSGSMRPVVESRRMAAWPIG